MKITFDSAANSDLGEIFAWIEKDSPRAARAVIERIERRTALLAVPGLSYMGRPGRDPGTYELVEPPYIIVYEVHIEREEIVVLAVFHGARNRENDPR
jgi:plasmid stabilization system protein ParE